MRFKETDARDIWLGRYKFYFDARKNLGVRVWDQRNDLCFRSGQFPLSPCDPPPAGGNVYAKLRPSRARIE